MSHDLDKRTIEWDRVRAVGFDLMDTLIYDPFREAICATTGMDLETLGKLRNNGAYHRFELDELTEAEFGERFFAEDSKHRLDVVELRNRLRDGYRFLPGVEQLMADVAEVADIVIMSNYSRWYDFIREKFELDRFVKAHQPSYVVGARKPDPRYYTRVADAVSMQPGQIVFVDDRQKNVDGAFEVGMPALLFDDAERLREQMQPLLGRAR